MGACDGHRCDGCPTCLSGSCCGEEVGQADLPAQGSWPGPLHAPLGELVERDGKVLCHICGKGVVGLTRHLTHKHKGVTADKYRAYFGLACGHSLLPQHEIDRRREQAISQRLAGFIQTPPPRATSEQLSVIATKRESRIEVAKKRKTQLTPAFGRRAANIRWGKLMARRPKLEEYNG